MKFRTELSLPPSASPLDPEKPVALLGSCFSENIGRRMRRSLWDARVNPCGVLFNPASIRRVLEIAAEEDSETRDSLLAASIARKDDLFVSMLFDSSFANADFDLCLDGCIAATDMLRDDIAESQALIVTLGTVRVYAIAGHPDLIVGNCHKFPAAKFQCRSLSVAETVGEITRIEAAAAKISPSVRIIYTVSPVRHLRDNFHDNTLSKATLQLAVAGKEYFPAYELLLDDLRDYRFYAADLAHPSEEAVGYIWEKFLDVYAGPGARKLLEKGEELTRLWEHRPNIPFGDSYNSFLTMRMDKTVKFNRKHPEMLSPSDF